MTLQEFKLILKDHKKYWTLKKQVLRRLKLNKNHREQRIKQIVKRKMKHIK